MSIIFHRFLYRENAWLLLLWWQHSLGLQDGSPSGLQCNVQYDFMIISNLGFLTVLEFVVSLTVHSLICGALDQTILIDQQVKSWTGSIQVPEPDYLSPALGKIRSLIQQRQGKNSSIEKQICKDNGHHDKQHDSTNPLADGLLQLPLVSGLQWFSLYCAF